MTTFAVQSLLIGGAVAWASFLTFAVRYGIIRRRMLDRIETAPPGSNTGPELEPDDAA